jgi:g-D-glutamyl-meso-diaminopimelate peptidase
MKVYARNGDTLWYLSKLFGLPFDLLIDSNRILNPDRLDVGEEVDIPGFEAVAYRIKPGDSQSKIASKQNIPVDAINILNNQFASDKLIPGDPLFLPKRILMPCVQANVPCDFKRLNEMLYDLKNLYPFIKIHSIGGSVLGKPILEIRVGRGSKKVHFNGAFHANEWITTSILIRLLNNYLLLLTNGTADSLHKPLEWYNNVELSLVPMVNPDGVDLVLNGPPEAELENVLRINEGNQEFVHWKANIRGVDLNKQFPANWEIDKNRKAPPSPSPRDYPGKKPLTEPEAIAMAELARLNAFDLCLAFHTQGEEFYWGYEGHEGPESAEMAIEFEKTSGYKAVQYVDSHAGYKDWFLQEFKRPAFTLELGKGINPLPLSQFDHILKKVEGIFFTVLSH